MLFDDVHTAEEPARAAIRIRLDQNSEFLEFEVDMLSIPVYADTQGKDVVVEWSFPGMNFGRKLWYSANGLQMMDKTMNYREQF